MKYGAPLIDQLIEQHGKVRVAMSKGAPMGTATHDGYCVKCKAKKTGVQTQGEKVHKNKMKSVHGPCPTCGTQIHRMVGKA